MFNTIDNSSKTTFNTPATGIIQRSNSKSFFLNFHYDSGMSQKLFNSDATYRDKDVVVLQVMLIHNNYVLAEVIYKKDFEVSVVS